MEFQRDIGNFFTLKGWPYWGQLAILARLMEEVGEFSTAVNHHHGEKQVPVGDPIPDEEEEIGDILFTLACYANKQGIDLEDCALKSLKKVGVRDRDRWT